MQSRARSIIRFCTSKLDAARIQQNMRNDRWKVIRNYRFNVSNRRFVMGNFQQYKNDPSFVDKCEVETRIMKRLYDSELVDLKTFSFDQDLREDLRLDSLNIVVLLTEIQAEFTTVFEDRVFQSVRKLSQLVDIIVRDQKVF